MEALSTLLAQFGQRLDARVWHGPRPQEEPRRAALTIAAEVGYPAERACYFCEDSLIEIDREKAAELLAFFVDADLGYSPSHWAREEPWESAREALADLKENALFYTNGGWPGISDRGWMPLSNATYDGGVIGFDDEHAFIYWVEDEEC